MRKRMAGRVRSLRRRIATHVFHRAYWGRRDPSAPWENTYWLGMRTQKCPLDLWVYQEILHERRPDVIVECGTLFGASAHFLASICDCLRHGRVISIDIAPQSPLPEHPRITYLTGSSVDPSVVERLRRSIGVGESVMAILDSDHARAHVLTELRIYSALVTPGEYLIVEDTNLNGHPVCPEFGPGPREAVVEFLAENAGFEADRSREKLLLTFNPQGYLRKREPTSRAGAA